MVNALRMMLTADARRIAAFALVVVGMALILPGVLKTIPTPWGVAQNDPNTQMWDVIAGTTSFAIGIFVLLFLPSRNTTTQVRFATGKAPIGTTVANLSQVQKRLFLIIYEGRAVLFGEIVATFNAPQTEVYYRLEVLWLQGLITKENVNERAPNPVWKYDTVPEVLRELGNGVS